MGIAIAEERTFASAAGAPSIQGFTSGGRSAASASASYASTRRISSIRSSLADARAGALDAARSLRASASRRIVLPLAIVLGAITLVATVPAIGAVASNIGTSPSATAVYGPPAELRAGAALGSSWEDSVRMSQPSAGDLGAALLAAQAEQQYQELVNALQTLNQQRIDGEKTAAASAMTAQAPGIPHSLGTASGYAPGTVIPAARITIYGCAGPGGGFCGGMAGGGTVFEGAAACSYDLSFGTRFTIAGDPTGRVYECMDRGALPSTWIDVFFYNTEDGFAWATQLGSTRAAITIVN